MTSEIHPYAEISMPMRPIILPIALILCGTILTAIGSLILAYQSAQKADDIMALNKTINEQAGEISLLSREIAEKSKKIEELTNTNLNYSTGGDSFCYLRPLTVKHSAYQRFLLTHQGNFPIYNISIEILDNKKLKRLDSNDFYFPDMNAEKWKELMQSRDVITEHQLRIDQAKTKIELPILTPHVSHSISMGKLEDTETDYFVRIFSRNGVFEEVIRQRLIDNGLWATSFRVFKTTPDGKNVSLTEQISKEAPPLD